LEVAPPRAGQESFGVSRRSATHFLYRFRAPERPRDDR
jgi:hypothetical protein